MKNLLNALVIITIFCGSALGATIGHWRFEEGSGTSAADLSGNGNTGTFWNDPTFVTDVALPILGPVCEANTYSLDFSAADQDAVVIPDSPSLRSDTAFTAEAWVKWRGGHVVLLGKQIAAGNMNSFQLEIFSDGVPRFQLSTTASSFFASGPSIAPNEWIHIAGVFSGTTMRLFINCTEVGSTTFTGPIFYDGNPFLIAAEDDSPAGQPSSFFMDGLIDEVRLSDTALDSSEFLCQSCAVPVKTSNWGSLKATFR